MAEQNALAKYDPRRYQVIARPEDLVPQHSQAMVPVILPSRYAPRVPWRP